MLKLFYLLFLIGITIDAQTIENFDTGNSGLSDNYVTSIAAVENAIIFSTRNGLTIYDGNGWQSFSKTEGLLSNNLSSSDYSLNNNIYSFLVGSDSGAVEIRLDSEINPQGISYLNQLNFDILSNNILSVHFDKMLNRWLGTDQGISMITQQDSLINISTSEGSMKIYNDYITSIDIADDTVRHKLDDYVPSTGVIYAATTGGGVSRFYVHDVDGITSASVVENTWSGLPSDTVFTVYIDRNNNHWYGTAEGAAVHMEHDSKNANWQIFNSLNGLINNRVKAICSDDAGNTWFGTEGGISKYDGSNWQSITQLDGLISDSVNDIAIDSEGTVWVGTDMGVSKLTDFTSTLEIESGYREHFGLTVNTYPNPFNSEINFVIKSEIKTHIYISVFNSIGEMIKEFPPVLAENRVINVKWNGKSRNGSLVNSGIYYVVVKSPELLKAEKIILLK